MCTYHKEHIRKFTFESGAGGVNFRLGGFQLEALIGGEINRGLCWLYNLLSFLDTLFFYTLENKAYRQSDDDIRFSDSKEATNHETVIFLVE